MHCELCTKLPAKVRKIFRLDKLIKHYSRFEASNLLIICTIHVIVISLQRIL